MEISRDSWHYKVWMFSHFSYIFNTTGRHLSNSTNICNYWIRVILYPIPSALLYIIFILLMLIIGITLFLFGNFITIAKGEGVGVLVSKDIGKLITIKWYFPDIPFPFCKKRLIVKNILYSSYGLLGSYFLLFTFPSEVFTVCKWMVGIIIAGFLLYGANLAIKKIKSACCFRINFRESEKPVTVEEEGTTLRF